MDDRHSNSNSILILSVMCVIFLWGGGYLFIYVMDNI